MSGDLMSVDASLARNGALSYLEIAAREPERSAPFYAKTLGWRVERRGPGDVRFSDPDGQLIGRFRSDLAAGTAGFVPFVYVRDIRAATERAQEAGGDI